MKCALAPSQRILSSANNAKESHRGARNRSHQMDSYIAARGCAHALGPRRAASSHNPAAATVRRSSYNPGTPAECPANQNGTWPDRYSSAGTSHVVTPRQAAWHCHRSQTWRRSHFELHLWEASIVKEGPTLDCARHHHPCLSFVSR